MQSRESYGWRGSEANNVCFPPLIKPDGRFSRIRLSAFHVQFAMFHLTFLFSSPAFCFVVVLKWEVLRGEKKR